MKDSALMTQSRHRLSKPDCCYLFAGTASIRSVSAFLKLMARSSVRDLNMISVVRNRSRPSSRRRVSPFGLSVSSMLRRSASLRRFSTILFLTSLVISAVTKGLDTLSCSVRRLTVMPGLSAIRAIHHDLALRHTEILRKMSGAALHEVHQAERLSMSLRNLRSVPSRTKGASEAVWGRNTAGAFTASRLRLFLADGP
jgi:hypothetical protein